MRRIRFILPTHICNYNCIYCHHEGCISSPDINLITPMEFKKKINQIIDRDQTFGGLVISGGEPCMFRTLHEYFSPIDFPEKILVTNGSLLNVELFQRLYKAGLTQVNVSIPSFQNLVYQQLTNQKNYHLNQIAFNIGKCSKYNVLMQANCVLKKTEKLNEIWIKTYIDKMISYGIRSFTFIENLYEQGIPGWSLQLFKNATFLKFERRENRGYLYYYKNKYPIFIVSCGVDTFYEYPKNEYGDLYISCDGKEYVPSW